MAWAGPRVQDAGREGQAWQCERTVGRVSRAYYVICIMAWADGGGPRAEAQHSSRVTMASAVLREIRLSWPGKIEPRSEIRNVL